MLLITIVIVLVSELASCVTESDSGFDFHNGSRWTYGDETNWPGNLCRENGQRQSPIDIKLSHVKQDFNKEFIKYGPLKFSGYQQVLVTGINNGYTIQFSTEGDASMHPTLTGGPLQHKYRLEQLHFHWLSEHSIEGIKYPMEIHFVHVRSDLPIREALQKKDGLAIISVFCNVQAELDERLLEATDEIMQWMPDLMKTGDRVSGVILDMTKLLSPRTDYFTYAGSLTSPPCNEAVIWIIFTTPIYILDARYRLFSKLRTGGHNFRSVQRRSRHLVYQSPHTDISSPAMMIFLEKMVRIVSDFFKNITRLFSYKFGDDTMKMFRDSKQNSSTDNNA